MQYYCAVLFCVGVYAKDLHIKESIDTGGIANDVDKNVNAFYHYDDNVYTEKERYARHVELVTESVIDHLMNEIKRKYPASRNESGIPKMMKRLKIKLKQMNKKKLKKQRMPSRKKHNDDSHVTTPQHGSGTIKTDNFVGSLV